MECSENVGHLDDQSNSNGNEEVQIGSTRNQRSLLDPSEQQRLDMGEMLQYSSHEEESALHTQEVSLMLSKAARTALIGWESHGSSIIKATFGIMKEGMTINVIQCYAPTNNSSDDNKDQFYSRLQSATAKFPRKDLNILMGDINVKVVMDIIGYHETT
ncbi:unnamed protein product [Schistosoma margrebowiei]|uniref:Uncharacterized protein n=1 Tax=Schistosoma margrebowiei TaxID=48269 RepID=A0A183MCL7_9TREM|nr:unnamed protein product [Schistosoma margrebowiei]